MHFASFIVLDHAQSTKEESAPVCVHHNLLEAAVGRNKAFALVLNQKACTLLCIS